MDAWLVLQLGASLHIIHFVFIVLGLIVFHDHDCQRSGRNLVLRFPILKIVNDRIIQCTQRYAGYFDFLVACNSVDVIMFFQEPLTQRRRPTGVCLNLLNFFLAEVRRSILLQELVFQGRGRFHQIHVPKVPLKARSMGCNTIQRRFSSA